MAGGGGVRENGCGGDHRELKPIPEPPPRNPLATAPPPPHPLPMTNPANPTDLSRPTHQIRARQTPTTVTVYQAYPRP